MNYPMIFLFLVTSLTKGIPSTYSTKSLRNLQACDDYSVDRAIRGAFLSCNKRLGKEVEYKIGVGSDRKTNGFLQTFFKRFFGTQSTTIPANSGILEDIFGTKIIFRDVNFYFHEEDEIFSDRFSLIPQNESDDQISVSADHFRITLKRVELRGETNESRSRFELYTQMGFRNFVLNATRTNEMKFAFDFSYKELSLWAINAEREISLWPLQYTFDFPRDREEDLTREITPILPVLLREHINRNPEFSQALDKIITQCCC